jgi:ferredoxin
MKHVQFMHSGRAAEVRTEASLLQALLVEQVPVKMACGGKGICATCHVYVERGATGLSPKERKEERTLAMLVDVNETSRLACQAKVLKEGVVVRLPRGLYIERTTDIEALVGRRSEVPVLHPVTGQVLVEEGKIITRNVVEKLRKVDSDMAKLLAESRKL